MSRYADALKQGYREVAQRKLITSSTILNIQRTLEQNDAGYRRVPGTTLVNDATGKTVYTPPQDYDTIARLMDNLVSFMNDDAMSELDPLVKMALMHHQFETIHPFYDGNGRTGRILNILYLVQQGLLKLPILYLSRFIIQNKQEYYFRLQSVRETANWEPWILYILKGVEVTARETIELIEGIRTLMHRYKEVIRSEYPKMYSQDLLNNLFKHPYTKIEFVMEELGVSRPTATRYLNSLVEGKLLSKHRIGNAAYYMNMPLFKLFAAEVQTGQPVDNIRTVSQNF